MMYELFKRGLTSYCAWSYSESDLSFVEAPAVCFPAVTITAEQIALIERETQEAALAVPLPDEDEDL